MSRRRRDVQPLHVVIHVECHCGRHLGRVVKNLDMPTNNTRSPYHVLAPLEFRDVPDPTDDTGKVARRCPECGAEIQRTWRKLRAMLDELETRGDSSLTIRG